jgi:CcmD family protein
LTSHVLTSETKDLTLLAIGVLVVWLGIGWYMIRLGRAQNRLEQEIAKATGQGAEGPKSGGRGPGPLEG